MTDIFLHGVETVEKDGGPRPVQTVDTGVIGLIGTAPDADATAWPVNTPKPLFGVNADITTMGVNGTLPDAINDILGEGGRVSQTIVVVRVEEGVDLSATLTNLVGSITTKTGVHAFRRAPTELNLRPKIFPGAGYSSQRPTDGITGANVTLAGVGYTEAPVVSFSGGGGSGAEAIAVIDSEAGTVTGITVTNPGFGYSSAPTITLTGGGASTPATATSTLGTVANPLTKELLKVAAFFRGVVIKDSTGTTAADAVTDRLDYDSDRLYIVEPMVKVFRNGSPVNTPASAMVAGLMAKVDYEEGFWVSPSNHVLQSAIGTSRSIDHSIGDPGAESQYLNKNDVATVVRSPSGGFKLWGNHVATSDSLKKFVSVRRGHDTIIDSIELACEPFIDMPFSLQTLLDISETVSSALRRWQALGATLGGRVWLDTTLNTKETWASGQLFINYDAETPAPIQKIQFIFSRNTGYYEELAETAALEISRIAGAAAQ